MKKKQNKYELGNKIIVSGLVKPYDFIDVSFEKYRLKELEEGILHKQMSNGLCPCIKTNMNCYAIVIEE